MRNVKFIYNPYSGENLILDKIDKIIQLHQEAGYSIIPYRISKNSDISEAFEDFKRKYASFDEEYLISHTSLKHNSLKDLPQ